MTRTQNVAIHPASVWLRMAVLALGIASLSGRVAAAANEVDRSPVDVVLGPDESWLATANQTSDTVTLVRTSDGVRLDEVQVGRRPAALVRTADGSRLLVAASHGEELTVIDVAKDKLTIAKRIPLRGEPHGVAPTADGRRAFVALTSLDKVVEVDLSSGQVLHEIPVGRWPRYLALSPDESRLAVGASGDGAICVIDVAKREMIDQERCYAINIGHMTISKDGKQVYFPWHAYRHNAITPQMIRLGWVIGSRIGRKRLDEKARREAISLDVPGKAVADPFGIGLTPDEQYLLSSASGTQELLVYRLQDLPLKEYANLDLINPALARDGERFWRIPLGGRPMGMRVSADGKLAYVANYLDNSVQVVDFHAREVVRRISLGGAETPSLARRGEAIFYDGKRSLDQWYSCHTCHYEGGTNSERMDTFNDGTPNTFKTVLPLFNVHETAPWTWHGWQTDLADAMHASLTTTMLGPKPDDGDSEALIAYLQQMESPPNPHRGNDGAISDAAQRGEKVFRSEKANCATCHAGPYFTDGKVHDVGLGAPTDHYQGYNTPSLRNVYRKVKLLHDGRGKSLEQVLTEDHNPEKVTGKGALTEEELKDLVEYLRTL